MLNMSWSGGFEFKNFNCSKQLLFVHAKCMGWCINHVVLVGFDKWYSASHNRNKKILFSPPICNNIYIYIYSERDVSWPTFERTWCLMIESRATSRLIISHFLQNIYIYIYIAILLLYKFPLKMKEYKCDKSNFYFIIYSLSLQNNLLIFALSVL